jgi:hypothetical protein
VLWQEVRDHYPEKWVLVEALDGRTEGDKRIVQDLSVIDTFSDSMEGFDRYRALHRNAPQRELYVVHTGRESLDILERRWVGPRTAI